jgi:hypothetical protein
MSTIRRLRAGYVSPALTAAVERRLALEELVLHIDKGSNLSAPYW